MIVQTHIVIDDDVILHQRGRIRVTGQINRGDDTTTTRQEISVEGIVLHQGSGRGSHVYSAGAAGTHVGNDIMGNGAVATGDIYCSVTDSQVGPV